VSTELRGAAGEPALLANPGGVDLDDGIVGVAGDRVAIDVTNIGFIPVTVSGLDLGGANPDDFRIVSEACTGRALNPDASCAVEIQFVPRGPGYRSALLLATATTPIGRPYTAAVVGGFARYDPVFLRDENTPARPGGQIGIGGSGSRPTRRSPSRSRTAGRRSPPSRRTRPGPSSPRSRSPRASAAGHAC
jgi:hypothetical protein